MNHLIGNKHHFKHGLSRHKLYGVWSSMNGRCYRKTCEEWVNYAARGITVCDEWKNDFMSFYNWAKNKWSYGLNIDRIDNDGNYEPNNCRFVTPSQSAHNQRLLRSVNTSGYRGVSRHKKNKKWVANIGLNGERIYLGSFDSPRLAAIRYDVEAFLLDDGRPMNFIIG